MNLQEFISTGIIESYVLGTASKEEVALLFDMKKKFPEIEIEIEKTEEALLLASVSNSPSSRLKENVWKEVFPVNENKVVLHPAKSPSKNPFLRYGIAASVALLMMSASANIYFYGKLQSLESEVSRLHEEKTYMVNELDVQKASLTQVKEQLAVATNPDNHFIPLKGLDISPESSVLVYWNAGTHQVHVSVENLPDAPQGKQYQLWAIADGIPVDAGMLKDTSGIIQSMKDIEKAQAFAITLEKEGGSQAPTLDAMFVLGSI